MNDEKGTLDADDESHDGQASDLDRRDYLQSIGAVSAASILGGIGLGAGVAGSAAAQATWEDDADERIEAYRTGDLEVVVENPDGTPVENAEVSVEQQSHDFDFGCMAHAEFLTRGSEWGDDIHTDEDQERYRETLEEHFNMIVLENIHKWNLWEDNTEIADEAVEWARERDMDVRGHVCLWGNIDAHAIPPRVVEAMGEDWEEAGEPDHDPDYVVEESMDHIETVIEHYGDDIKEWEIKNEVFHEPAMIEAVEGDNVTPETAEILGDCYEFGKEVADQYGIDIAVNDYNTLNGNHTQARQQYHDQIDFLVNERGIGLDGIGMQSHHYADERIDPDTMMNRLDEYAEYGSGLRVTEFDMFGDGWDQQMEADYLHQFLKTFFSHPEAEQFLMWGHWDPLHWGPEMGDDPNAPLYEEDWTEKPAYDEYVGLVFDEWWNDESGGTDADGLYTTNAYLGDHRITVETDSDSETTTTSVTDADGTTTIEVTVSGDGLEDPGDDPGEGDDGDDDDVDEDDDPDDTPGDAPTWHPDEVYTEGDRVCWDGSIWEAQWWTQDQEPDASQWGPWEDVGDADEPADDPDEDPDDDPDDSDDPNDESSSVLAHVEPSTTAASVGDRITFSVDDTSGSGRWIDSLEFDFGDGSTATGWWAEHSYDSAGTYTVELAATDGDGATTTDAVTIAVA